MKSKLRDFLPPNYWMLLVSVFLLAAGWSYYDKVLQSAKGKDKLVEEIERSIENEINLAQNNFTKLDPAADNFPELYVKSHRIAYPLYIYKNGHLLFWSDFNFIPNAREISGDFHIRVTENRESFYLLIKYSNQKTESIYVIPLLLKYPIVNEYLKSHINDRIFTSDNFELSLSARDGFDPVYHSQAKSPLFFVRLNPHYGSVNPLQFVLVNGFFLTSLFLFVIFLWQVSKQQLRKLRYGPAFLWLTTGLLLLRAGMIFLNYPFLVFPNDLFNPRNYASSFINPSLGDLFLNILCLFILTAFLFKYYLRIRLFKKLVACKNRRQMVVSSFLVFFNLILLSIFFLLFNSLNLHSQWSLDISRELNFHSLKIASYVIVVVAGIIYFFLSHMIFRIIFHNYRNDWRHIFTALAIGTISFVIVSLIDHWDFILIAIVNAIYFLVLYLFNFPQYLRRVQYLTFVYFFVGSIPLCIVGSYSVYRYQLKRLIQEKDKLASQLLVDNDVLTEYLLNEAAGQISEDVFIQNRILNPYVSKINIKQRVQRVYLNNQLEKYDVDIHLYNSRGLPLDDSGESLNEILKRFEAYKLKASNLYFINKYEGNSLKRYLKVVEIKRYSRVAGYVLIDLKLKRVIPNSVYPMLLIDNRYSGPDITADYSYAIYENGNLIFNSGDYNYSEKLEANFDLVKTTKRLGHYEDGLVHFSVSGEHGRTYLISLKAYPVQNVFSNFSFLFTLFLGNILAALIIITAYMKIKGIHQNYASRIQLFLNAAFLIPLIIICISAISVIVKSYNENLEVENLERASNISKRISENLNTFLERGISRERLFEEVNGISRFSEIDINVFGNNGRLLATSQPLIYENDLLSEMINPAAYTRITYGNEGGMVLNEHIGRLFYKNTYMPIKSPESGQRIGILSLPYFGVRKELEENVISVLTNVLNIFTIIFFIFLVLSYLASTWLTFPLRLITQKIRKTSLLDTNEPLEWNSDDEIGLMVGEYNAMLLNLEESKKALARSEKESAWREIARQVAHEIKNPLTPMKLTLQHMKRTLNEDNIEKEKRIRQIDALLHQINTLSDIATSFSAFAKMPVPQNEPFELAELLKDTIAIYDKTEQLTVNSEIEARDFWVEADRKWIGQAISNILINGIHAAEEREEKLIEVSLKGHGKNRCLLTISDNGKGIPEEIRSKIFMPDFSTKQTGSGIGLAIAKRAVEHAGGEIWFDTELGKGTIFNIELPLVK